MLQRQLVSLSEEGAEHFCVVGGDFKCPEGTEHGGALCFQASCDQTRPALRPVLAASGLGEQRPAIPFLGGALALPRVSSGLGCRGAVAGSWCYPGGLPSGRVARGLLEWAAPSPDNGEGPGPEQCGVPHLRSLAAALLFQLHPPVSAT